MGSGSGQLNGYFREKSVHRRRKQHAHLIFEEFYRIQNGQNVTLDPKKILKEWKRKVILRIKID